MTEDDFKCPVRNILTKINGCLLKWMSANVNLIGDFHVSGFSKKRNPCVLRARVFIRPRPSAAKVAVSAPSGVEIIYTCMRSNKNCFL